MRVFLNILHDVLLVSRESLVLLAIFDSQALAKFVRVLAKYFHIVANRFEVISHYFALKFINILVSIISIVNSFE